MRNEPAPRGYLVAFTCWGRPDMPPLLMEAWARHYKPDDASLLFIFDSPQDDGVARFWEHRILRMAEYDVGDLINNGPEVHENGMHDMALTEFEQFDYYYRSRDREPFHTLVVFQDDMLVEDAGLLDKIDRLRLEYSYRLGVVGGRDGFRHGYSDMAGSLWSASTGVVTRLNPGEHAERPLLNRGPVAYPMHVVRHCGHLDRANFPTWFGEVDYCARVTRAGYTNVVVGTALSHETRGRKTASWHYDDNEEVARQAARLREKHPDLHAC